MSTRESFLARVRQAVRDGNRSGSAAPLPDRGTIGYQGAGTDPLARFLEMNRAMGSFPAVVDSVRELTSRIAEVLASKGAKKILVGRAPLLDELKLREWVGSTGRIAVNPDADKAELFAADASITGVSALIAETGSVVVRTGGSLTRGESLLPPVHIAVARRDQITADLFDVFDDPTLVAETPSNLVFITGPSKTGDIELKLVTGVHGPGEVHVLIV